MAEWKYKSRLPGYALSRWRVTREFLCRYFKDWKAIENSDYLTETALLPVVGFEYEDGDTARLEYISANREYTLDRLARAGLNFSQEELRKYPDNSRQQRLSQ